MQNYQQSVGETAGDAVLSQDSALTHASSVLHPVFSCLQAKRVHLNSVSHSPNYEWLLSREARNSLGAIGLYLWKPCAFFVAHPGDRAPTSFRVIDLRRPAASLHCG
eukprot:10397-Heterococcus_DN1.PRE.3